MEITVHWAEGGDIPAHEDHILFEQGRSTASYDDVVNVKFHLYRERGGYPLWDESYPHLSLIHEDGSITRGRGRLVDAAGDFGSVVTCEYDARKNAIETRQYDNCVGVWWEATRDDTFGRPRTNLHIVCTDSEGETFHADMQWQMDYVAATYPDGTTETRGTSPVHDHEPQMTGTGESLTVEVQDTEKATRSRTVTDVERVSSTRWDTDREFLVERTDGVVEQVYDVLNVDSPGYTVYEARDRGAYRQIITHFDCLCVTDTLPEDEQRDDVSYRVAFRPKQFHQRNVAVTQWKPQGDTYVVSPSGTVREA